MLCANCLDVDLFAILKGDHKGIPVEEGREVWITRTSDPTTIWVWDSQSGCEFCEFLSTTQIHLIPQDASIKPRYLQLDRGKSWVRKWDRHSSSTEKLSSHINVVFDTLDGRPEEKDTSYPDVIVSFGVPTDIAVPELQPAPLQVDEIPTWLDIGTIKRHLKYCLQHHKSCYEQKETPTSQPSQLRVIDCSTRLIVTPSGDISYVALSYRWGNSHTESQDRQAGMLPTDIPATIEDAMKVTQSLGFQYLWVDAYCVLQTDENDFQHQIRQMHLIYRSAQITIIAAGSMDANSGLTGFSTPRENMQTKGQYEKLHLITFSLWPWALAHFIKGWIDRGWTFQESYFSQRRLVFTDKQVLFDCNEGVISEDLQHSQVQYIYELHKWQPNAKGEAIYNLIQTYTAKHLTYETDILNAFNGILGDFEQQEPPVRSHWGIPLLFDTSGYLNGLLNGLCWCTPVQDGKFNRRSDFPSWSWTGWLHNPIVEYPLRRCSDTKLVVAHDLVVQVEKLDGLTETWKDFEKASLNSTQRIHLSAPSVKVMLRKKLVHVVYMEEQLLGHGASVLKGDGDGCWSNDAGLESPFESLELSRGTRGSIEIRTCYAIYLFSAEDMRDPWGGYLGNVFALLLVSKVETNWERVGLWTPTFESKEEALSFEQWLQNSSTYEVRDFWIA